MDQKLKTIALIINGIMNKSEIKFDVEIHLEEDNIFVDFHPHGFIGSRRHEITLGQVKTSMWNKIITKRGITQQMNYFEYDLMFAGEDLHSKAWIRFTIYELPYIGLYMCKTCGKVTERTYGSQNHKRNCPTCGFIESSNCKMVRD